jgi:hypothetical protein
VLPEVLGFISVPPAAPLSDDDPRVAEVSIEEVPRPVGLAVLPGFVVSDWCRPRMPVVSVMADVSPRAPWPLVLVLERDVEDVSLPGCIRRSWCRTCRVDFWPTLVVSGAVVSPSAARDVRERVVCDERDRVELVPVSTPALPLYPEVSREAPAAAEVSCPAIPR